MFYVPISICMIALMEGGSEQKIRAISSTISVLMKKGSE